MGSTIRSEVTATEHATPPVGDWDGPMTITSGGVYTVQVESTSSTPAITIATTQPVTITGRVRNLIGGPLIEATGAGAVQVDARAHLRLRTDLADGPLPLLPVLRVQVGCGQKLHAREHTGDVLRGGAANSSVLVTKNRQTNIKGQTKNPLGTFAKFQVCASS